MYDLILFNNATKQTHVYTGLTDSGEKLYYEFDNFDAGDIPYGEYAYALIYNELSGVTYEPKNALLDTLVTYDGQTYRLGDLSPELGLLKYVPEESEEEEKAPSYRDSNVEYYYRRK